MGTNIIIYLVWTDMVWFFGKPPLAVRVRISLSYPMVVLMKISAKTEYACIAVMELAKSQGSNEPVRIRNIAEQHQVPPRFLVQILLQLKGAGIVSSIRGAAGGYHLIPKPEDVTLGQVMNIIDGPVQTPKRAGDQEGTSLAVNVLSEVWVTAEKKRQDHLCSVSFAELVRLAEPSASDKTKSEYGKLEKTPNVKTASQSQCDPVTQDQNPVYV